MATLTNANFWIYFTKAEVADRVTCKICRRSLKAKRSFNLRQHLKQSHKIEFRIQKRTSHKKKHQSSPNGTDSLTTDIIKENSALKIKNAKRNQRNNQSLDSNDSLSRMSTNIKEETIHCRSTAKSYVDSVELVTPFDPSNSESDDNEEISRQNPPTPITPQNNINNRGHNKKNNVEAPTENSLIKPLFLDKPDAIIEPSAIPREHRRDPLSSFDVLTNGEHSFQSKKKKTERFADDEVTASNRNDSFEIWARKKKLLLEIEELEMRNYKIKLELWEREQNLRLICSKFTKDIRSNK